MILNKRWNILLLVSFLTATTAMAQFDSGPEGGGFPPMGAGPMGMEQDSQNGTKQHKKGITDGIDLYKMSLIGEDQATKLMKQLGKAIERHNKTLLTKFDTNKDGKLDKSEQRAWKKWIEEQGGNDRPAPPMGGFPMQGGKAQDTPSIVPTAVNSFSTKSALKEKTLTSMQANESVVRIKTGSDFQGEDLTIKKEGGNTTSNDESNFYGLNAAFAAEAASTATLNGGLISTDAEGANAVFAYGKGANITINNICIDTKKNSSRGLDATFGGNITASDVTITTQGAHCAALATDRGEGSVTVSNCNATTHGEGSPGIYSTGAITAENSSFYATGSEAAVIEGKNSITLDNCTLTGMKNWGVMLYQSFSGDAGVGTSSIVMKNSKLTAAEGPLFYCTNTRTNITLDNDKLSGHNGILLQAAGNSRWGHEGQNGAQVTFQATNQQLEGIFDVDSISSAKITLGTATHFTGAINPSNQSKQIEVIIEKGSSVSLTADSYIRKLTLVGMSDEEAAKCIVSNGHKLHITETK